METSLIINFASVSMLFMLIFLASLSAQFFALSQTSTSDYSTVMGSVNTSLPEVGNMLEIKLVSVDYLNDVQG